MVKDNIKLKELLGVYKETFPRHRYEEDIKTSYNNDETIAIKPGERHVFLTDGVLSDKGVAEFLKLYGGLVHSFSNDGQPTAIITNLNHKGYIRVKKGMEIGAVM